MNVKLFNVLSRFARFGVLRCEALKNDIETLKFLLKQGIVKKSIKSGRVFYELTYKSLPVLEQLRKVLLEKIKFNLLIDESSVFYRSLLEDVRFLDETSSEADKFLFLGDWQLIRPVSSAQLELSKLRFYDYHVEKRTRKVA